MVACTATRGGRKPLEAVLTGLSLARAGSAWSTDTSGRTSSWLVLRNLTPQVQLQVTEQPGTVPRVFPPPPMHTDLCAGDPHSGPETAGAV